LPVLFVCENNLYAMGTALSLSESETDIHRKAESYRIDARVVDGMDVRAVAHASHEAIAGIRADSRPRFLEMRTYRFRAHSMFDPELYRSKDEVEAWKKHCPIESFVAALKQEKCLSDDEWKQMEKNVAEEIKAAVVFAEAGTWESINTLERHVYTEPSP